MKNILPLFLIIVVASVLRFVYLSTIPPHLTPDEAALGYNAFSILKTGRDEYGDFLPLVFKSFGDFKPGLYIYFSVPFVWAFGLNEFSVRLASAVAGVIAVWLFYQIVSFLSEDKKIALIGALLLAINPWHILLSRGAWEVNVSLTLTLAGLLLFFRGLKNYRYMFLSAFFFALTFLCYQGAKLSTGIVVILLAVVYWKDIRKISFKKLILPSFVAVLISLPTVISIFKGETGRLAVFSIFSYPRPQDYVNHFLSQGGEKVGQFSYYLYHSELLNFVRGILGRWFNHYSLRFLFIEGDWANPRHAAPYHGMFTLFDAIPMLIGIIIFFREKLTQHKLFILLWLILAPLPATLSRDQIHAVRAYNLVIPLVTISAYGIYYLCKASRVTKVSLILVFVVSYLYFLDAYFIHVSKHNSKLWDYGYKQIVETVTPIQHEFREVRIQQSYAQPYIYFLFYQKYDPAKYQSQAYLTPSDVALDVGKVEHLDNLYFGPIDWSINRGTTDVLFIGDTIRIPIEDSSDPKHFKTINEIKYLDGTTAFRIIDIIE